MSELTRLFPYYALSLMAAADKSMAFNRKEEIEQENQRHKAWKEAQNVRLQRFNKEHRPKTVFSIHGIEIEATSRKDAIKIYNAKYGKTNMARNTYLNLKGYEHVIVHRGNVKIEPCKGRNKH